jgi:hypothetical protein
MRAVLALANARRQTLKASLTDKFGFTDRQMSSVAFLIDGKAKGILEGMKTRVEDLQGRIASAENRVKKWNTTLKQELSKDAKHRDWHVRLAAARLVGKKPPLKPRSSVKFSPNET